MSRKHGGVDATSIDHYARDLQVEVVLGRRDRIVGTPKKHVAQIACHAMLCILILTDVSLLAMYISPPTPSDATKIASQEDDAETVEIGQVVVIFT
ncbi:MAG: hypothetical protein U0638_16490 [Phycisphaerales bacterium]